MLLDGSWDAELEMVLTYLGEGEYRAAGADGWAEFRRRSSVGVDGVGRWAYETLATHGRDPLADGATDRFLGHAEERARSFPRPCDNSYPYAHDSIAQFFDGAHAPEMVLVHTAGHHFSRHLGEHGSPAVTQARAPFLAAGAGIRADGLVDRHLRVVDIAPTIAAVLGLAQGDGVGPDGTTRGDAFLARQDGDPDERLLDGDTAEHVVVFLLDGCNANLFADVIDAGEAPILAALRARGAHYREGLFASMPTATLANHTCAVTGAHPGHSGVLHNTWYDRHLAHVPDLLALDQIHSAMVHLDPRVETLYQAIRRCRPEAFTSATFEFCDTGADHSAFAEIRAGHTPPFPDLATMPHLSREHAASSEQYTFMSMVDHTSAAQTIRLWEGHDGNPLPTLSWVSLAITDEAGHESGPHGAAARAAVRDSDGRLGDVLAAVEAAGAIDRTAVFVIADHGMQQNDPANDRSWAAALASTGVPLRDVGDGFVYLS